MGEAAWKRINALIAEPLPDLPPKGAYLGRDVAVVPQLQGMVRYSFGLLEATQSLLVSAGIVAGLVFEADKSGPRVRDHPRLVVSADFPELVGIEFPELKRTAARDYSVHLRPHLSSWHRKFAMDHPRLISTWHHGPGPDFGEPFRFLDTKKLRVRVKDEWSDLRGLAQELGLIGTKIPLKALVRREDPPVPDK